MMYSQYRRMPQCYAVHMLGSIPRIYIEDIDLRVCGNINMEVWGEASWELKLLSQSN